MAETKYGTQLWESHWAKLTTDGDLTVRAPTRARDVNADSGLYSGAPTRTFPQDRKSVV